MRSRVIKDNMPNLATRGSKARKANLYRLFQSSRNRCKKPPRICWPRNKPHPPRRCKKPRNIWRRPRKPSVLWLPERRDNSLAPLNRLCRRRKTHWPVGQPRLRRGRDRRRKLTLPPPRRRWPRHKPPLLWLKPASTQTPPWPARAKVKVKVRDRGRAKRKVKVKAKARVKGLQVPRAAAARAIGMGQEARMVRVAAFQAAA